MTDSKPMVADLRAALSDVLDPEVGLSVVDLGLIYDLAIDDAGVARVRMTMTTPSCPAGEVMLDAVERRLSRVPGVARVLVEVTYDPPWTPDRITEAGRARLGMSP